MPIYEYRCQSCDHEFEKLQRLSDDVLVDCPDCGRPELKKLVSAAGFRLKGGGWYETDFKKDSKRNLAGDSDAKSSEPKSPESKEKKADKSSDKQSGKTSSGSKSENAGKAA